MRFNLFYGTSHSISSKTNVGLLVFDNYTQNKLK